MQVHLGIRLYAPCTTNRMNGVGGTIKRITHFITYNIIDILSFANTTFIDYRELNNLALIFKNLCMYKHDIHGSIHVWIPSQLWLNGNVKQTRLAFFLFFWMFSNRNIFGFLPNPWKIFLFDLWPAFSTIGLRTFSYFQVLLGSQKWNLMSIFSDAGTCSHSSMLFTFSQGVCSVLIDVYARV